MGTDGRIMDRWEVLCFDGCDESSSGCRLWLQAPDAYISFHTERTLFKDRDEVKHKDLRELGHNRTRDIALSFFTSTHTPLYS